MSTATVVGSGPNGLAAAARLARAGIAVTVFEAADGVGGGTRSSEAIRDGLLHDHCSAFHPIAAASPLYAELELEARGVRWLQPEVDCAHPLDSGAAGAFYKSLDDTESALGADGAKWRQVFGPSSQRLGDLLADATQPILRVPRHPMTLARFGAPSALPASVLAKRFASAEAQALWAGVAAHAYYRLDRPLTSAVGMMLVAAGHAEGWVVAEGGSQSIADGLAAIVVEAGGRIETGHLVSSWDELPPSALVMLDVAPSVAARLLGDRLPGRVRRAYQRFRHGPGAFKVDFAIDGDVPWTAELARRAGTVHLGGDRAEVEAGELAIHRGRMPDRPFVLVGQQYLADASRSVGSINPLWTYAHVPSGYQGDATEAIVAQIERFAPGFREQVVGMAVRSTTDLSVQNPNFIGGDIIGGASTMKQLMLRPRMSRDPYFTGVPGVFLCSASTPPGAGAHGMCGANAAASALRRL